MARAVGLFGVTPGSLPAQMARERADQAAMLGQSRPGIIGGLAAGSLFDAEDPRLVKARAVKEIETEMSRLGLNPGDPEFTKQLVPRVRAKLGIEAALEAQQMALQAEVAQREVRGAASGPMASMRTLRRLGYSADEAADLAQDPELSRDIIKSALKRDKLPELMQLAEFVHPGDTDLQRKAVGNVLKARAAGQKIEINNYASKPLGSDAANWVDERGNRADPNDPAADATRKGYRPMTQAEQAAEKLRATNEQAQRAEAAEVSKAISQVESVVNRLSGKSVFDPADRKAYKFATQRLAKAIAQLRNPGSAEAGDQATEAIRSQLPSIAEAALLPQVVQQLLNEARLESTQAGGPSAGQAIEPAAGSTGQRIFRVISVE